MRIETVAAVGLVGHSGAGKTEVAAELAQELDGQAVSFGDEVRRVVAARGLDASDRKVLMRVGQSLVDEDVQGFCAAVLAQAEGTDSKLLIIEGIRHDVVRETLVTLLRPRRLFLVHLKAPEGVRVARLRRDGAQPEEVDALRHDPTEIQVDQVLLGHADLIVDADRPPANVVSDVIAGINGLASDATGGQPMEGQDAPEISGVSLDEQQQVELINEISSEFGVWLPREIPAAAAVNATRVQDLLDSRALLQLRHGRTSLVPGFLFREGDVRDEIVAAVAALRGRLDDWEIAAWLVSSNGWLGDVRPIDATSEELTQAVGAELEDVDF